MYHPDGGVSQGFWKHGKLHLKGRQIFENGDVYDGEWNYGEIHGFGVMKNSDSGSRYKGYWKHNK